MADITEQQEVAQEISDVISRPIGFGDEFDEVRSSTFGPYDSLLGMHQRLPNWQQYYGGKSYTNSSVTYLCVCVQDELMAELEELEQEELDKNLLEIQGTQDVPLPSVPSTSLPSRPGIRCRFSRWKIYSNHIKRHV